MLLMVGWPRAATKEMMTRRGEALSRLVSEEKLIRGVRRDAVCLVDSIKLDCQVR